MPKDYETKKQVDYITFSTERFAPIDDILGNSKECKPFNKNYNKAYRFNCGLTVQYHTEQPRMKQHVTMSGEVLDIVRDYGFSDATICEWAMSLKSSKIGRIDIAVTSWRTDGLIHGFLPQMAHYAHLNGMCETKLTLDKPVTNVNGEIETCYIGSRKARNRILRAYDKGVEMGGLANRIIRFEMETRKGANKIAEQVKAGMDIGGIIRRYVDFPDNEDYVAIMDSEPLKNTRDDSSLTEDEKFDKKRMDRWHWLMTSVSPTLAKALYEDAVDVDENEMFAKFTSMTAFHLRQLIDGKV